LTGNGDEVERRRRQHDEGVTLQRGVEMDLQRQADAAQRQKEAEQLKQQQQSQQ
jgi:hypothetical protein